MTATKWSPGDVVVWRESWRGTTYYSVPVRVLEDSERQLVHFLAEGTRFRFPLGAWPFAWEDWQPDPTWGVPTLPGGA